MIANYHTLRALATEWRTSLVGRTLEDVWSQERDELSLTFAGRDGAQTLRAGVRPPLLFIFSTDGYARARRNAATLFEQAIGSRLESLRIADRDRMLFLDLSGGITFQVALFGPRANVFLVASNRILSAFRNDSALAGAAPPAPRPAPYPGDEAAFTARYDPKGRSITQAVCRACPLFDRTLGAEIAVRAGLNPNAPAETSPKDREALFHAAETVRRDLLAPAPRIYRDEQGAPLFSLIALEHVRDLEEESFETVGQAVREGVRRSLAHQRFRELFDPLEKALERAVRQYDRRLQHMQEAESRESRADQYETWGHLLTAQAQDIPRGAEEASLQNLFSEGENITVPLDPALSAIENARHFYERARRARTARKTAERRRAETVQGAREVRELLDALRAIKTLQALRDFRMDREDLLARFLNDSKQQARHIPFRRFRLRAGYEVWAGRNARQNDELTFRHAQKYDLWMHARGVPGVHAVLRLPHRNAAPDAAIIRQAASIAAWFSKARGSGLAPVTVAERKYVRKAKGGPPGAVTTERETVLLVEPGLPDPSPEYSD